MALILTFLLLALLLGVVGFVVHVLWVIAVVVLALWLLGLFVRGRHKGDSTRW